VNPCNNLINNIYYLGTKRIEIILNALGIALTILTCRYDAFFNELD